MKIGYDAKRIFHNTTGLGNYCRDMIRILSAHYPVHEYLLYNPKAGKVNRLQADGIRIIEKRPASAFWRLFNSVWRQGAVLIQAESDNVEIYHGLSGEIPRGVEKSNIKSVLTVHDLIFVSHPHLYKAIDRKIYLNKLKYAVKAADVIVSISEYTKQQLVEHIDADPAKIKVIYQTCHPVFQKSVDLNNWDKFKNQFNLPENYILMVGTVEERKNVLALVKAIKDSDYHVVLVGRRTSYADQIDSFIKSNGLKDQVHFVSEISIEELAMFYHKAKLMVYTSLVEGFGIPLIEALYTSTPVICHHEGVFPEAAGPGSQYVDMADADAIRNKIDVVWSDEKLLSDMAQRGVEYAKRFDAKVIASEMMAVYQDLLK